MEAEPPAKKKRLFSDGSVSNVMLGLDRLFNHIFWLKLLRIPRCNGDEEITFPQASCTIKKHPELFPLPTFFHSTVKKIIELHMNEGGADGLSEHDRQLFKALFAVLEQSQDIAKKLQKLSDNKEELAIQLAHHLLIPLSVDKEYKINKQSRNHIKECVCCKEVLTETYGDTSMGHPKVWHGNTDILIGQNGEPEVAVTLCIVDDDDDTDDEEEDTSAFQIKDYFDPLRNQFIAQTIVSGFLQLKMNPSAKSLIPTIALSTKGLKLYLYDAHHDYLLESFPLPLFTKDGEDLMFPTVIGLWLAINYRDTSSGLTADVVNSGFKTNFMDSFSEEVKDRYRKELKFGNCRKKSFSFCQDDLISSCCNYKKIFAAPCDGSLDCFTEKHYDYLMTVATHIAR